MPKAREYVIVIASKTPNFQFPELVVNQDSLSATCGASCPESGAGCVCAAAQSSVRSNRRSYLVAVGGAHGDDRSTHRIHHVYGSRIGALGEHWGIVIHINHCNTDMGGCLENKMVSCILEYLEYLI